eukprot:7073484-Pyramimonas_sp.AAC.1
MDQQLPPRRRRDQLSEAAMPLWAEVVLQARWSNPDLDAVAFSAFRSPPQQFPGPPGLLAA